MAIRTFITALALLGAAPLSHAMSASGMIEQVFEMNPEADVHIYDHVYHSISKHELGNVIAEHARRIKRFGRSDRYRHFDCDDYTVTFKAVVALHSLFRGKNFACGIMVVKQQHTFAGIKGGDDVYHALNLILVDGVPTVLEPQNYKQVPLSEYPNRKFILGLIL